MAFDILFCLLACAHQLLDTDDDSGWWVFRGELRGGGAYVRQEVKDIFLSNKSGKR